MALQKASRRERKAAEQEAKLLSKLKHPNIVSYKESFESDDGNLYIVMGFAEGGDLYKRLREQRERNEHLPEVQVVRWFIQICMALQYLHQQHILHRDLKTQNIFLTKTKMIKVGDLGIARVLEGAGDMATTLIGTPYYMSPELFSNRPYNHKSDVWALGCCVYEMTTLKHAFNAKDMNSLVYKILKEKMPKMPDIYSSELCDLIKSMLHQNADKRPSVNRILRNSFIKKHIQLFLDESSRSRRPTSGKSRASAVESSSRRTSTSSVASRCSSRESNNSVFEPKSPVSEIPVVAKPRSSESSRQRINKYSPQGVGARKNEPTYVNIPTKNLSIAKPPKENLKAQRYDKISEKEHLYDEIPKDRPSINSGKDNVYVNIDEVQKSPVSKAIEAVVELRISGSSGTNEESVRSSPQITDKKIIGDGDSNDSPRPTRVKSAGSVSSSSSESSTRKQNTDSQPKSTSNQSATGKQSDSLDDNFLKSSEEKRSKSPTRTRVSSARERRRREKQKRARELKETEDAKHMEPPCAAHHQEQERLTTPDGDRKKDSISGEEVNQFYTLLHTTLKLSNQDSPPQTPPDLAAGDSASTPEEQARRSKLSPVAEQSESAASTLTEQDGPQSQSRSVNPPLRNTPRATDIVAPKQPQPSPPKPVSPGTLASTGRLMDRIVALRKECIRSLGVPLLHRAYTLLDENAEEDVLEKKLIDLLGEDRYNLWAGKIWQLKFCEESIFKHCGSITAY